MVKKSASLPTTSLLDQQRIQTTDVNKPEFKELLVRLWQTVNEIALVTNMKETGFYPETEFITSRSYFPDPALTAVVNTNPVYRPSYRIAVNFGALPNTGTKTVAHGLTFTNSSRSVQTYASATDPSPPRHFIPIPYASPILANNIALDIDDTNITITTGSNRTNFTECIIAFEFLKY